ncbi:MAG: hypothetical protein N3B16_05470 [Candidatus Aminicenantes bacterium]|nr:hypothetical protein [Candidatus Aminicenantes bacterium]
MKIKKLYFFTILSATILGLYWQSLNYPLIWDDRGLFENNPLFEENQSLIAALKASYFRQQIGIENVDFYYRPILMASFWLEDKLWGIHPISMRLINVILFISGISVWYLFLKARYDFSSFPEIATFLFALFPLHVDNIVWIVGRSDLLLILFSGLCLLFLDRYTKKGKKFFLLVASISYAFGMFSKESFLFLAPILMLAEYSFHKKINIFFHLGNGLITASYFLIKGPLLHIRNIPMLWPKQISSILSSLLGAIGYYIKAIIFPFGGPRFLSAADLEMAVYIFLGTLGVFVLLFLILLSKKKSDILLPASLIVFFLVGHSLLIFSRLFPYRAYSRYMIMPALGFIWILSLYLIKLKEKSRPILIFILLIAFIPHIVFLNREYRHEIIFWQKAVSRAPNDAYARCELANAYFKSKNYLDAELVLNRILSMKMPRDVALLVSLQYADLELIRANYPYVFRWLDSIDSLCKQMGMQLVPYMQVILRGKKALAELSLGRWEEAEKLLLENIKVSPEMMDSYRELYFLYIGTEQWDKAASLEEKMKERYPRSFKWIDTEKVKKELSNFNLTEKIAFYERYRNYNKAIEILEAEHDSINQENNNFLIFQLVRLYLKSGLIDKTHEIISNYLKNNLPQTEFLNKIAIIFIYEFNRIKEGLSYLQKSLELDKNQPEIKFLVFTLTQKYLNQLKPVWPDEKSN